MSRHKLTIKEIAKEFSLQSLAIQQDALEAVAKLMQGEYPGSAQYEVLDTVIEHTTELLGKLNRTMVDREVIQSVVAQLTRAAEDIQDQRLQIVSAFKMPRYTFNHARKSYHLDTSPRPLHAGAGAKVAMFRDRFVQVRERLARHKHIDVTGGSSAAVAAARGSAVAAAASGGASAVSIGGGAAITLTPIESTRAMTGHGVTVLGMITQTPDGTFEIEDLEAKIPLDLTHCRCSTGLFTESSVVLVEGEIRHDGALVATLMGNPPPESRSDSLRAMGLVDQFQVLKTPAEYSTALELETRGEGAEEVSMSFLSGCHLDDPSVVRNLERMMEGFSMMDAPPAVVVLSGPFLQRPYGSGRDDRRAFAHHMDALAGIINRHEAVATQTQFVLVPAATDPGSARVLPRPALPTCLCKGLLERTRAGGARVTLASNPCRLRYHTQEIVVFREDLGNKLQRLTVLQPDKSVKVQRHLLSTLLSQSHLCPLPSMQQPVYWEHDCALRLFPLPDIMVVAEDGDPYSLSDAGTGTVLMSPGSFASDGCGRFMTYSPASRRMVACTVLEEDEAAAEQRARQNRSSAASGPGMLSDQDRSGKRKKKSRQADEAESSAATGKAAKATAAKATKKPRKLARSSHGNEDAAAMDARAKDGKTIEKKGFFTRRGDGSGSGAVNMVDSDGDEDEDEDEVDEFDAAVSGATSRSGRAVSGSALRAMEDELDDILGLGEDEESRDGGDSSSKRRSQFAAGDTPEKRHATDSRYSAGSGMDGHETDDDLFPSASSPRLPPRDGVHGLGGGGEGLAGRAASSSSSSSSSSTQAGASAGAGAGSMDPLGDSEAGGIGSINHTDSGRSDGRAPGGLEGRGGGSGVEGGLDLDLDLGLPGPGDMLAMEAEDDALAGMEETRACAPSGSGSSRLAAARDARRHRRRQGGGGLVDGAGAGQVGMDGGLELELGGNAAVMGNVGGVGAAGFKYSQVSASAGDASQRPGNSQGEVSGSGAAAMDDGL